MCLDTMQILEITNPSIFPTWYRHFDRRNIFLQFQYGGLHFW